MSKIVFKNIPGPLFTALDQLDLAVLQNYADTLQGNECLDCETSLALIDLMEQKGTLPREDWKLLRASTVGAPVVPIRKFTDLLRDLILGEKAKNMHTAGASNEEIVEELRKLNPKMANYVAERLGKESESTAILDPDGFLDQAAAHAAQHGDPEDELWKVSPAAAMMRKFMQGGSPNHGEACPAFPNMDPEVMIPGELSAAIQTRRPSLLVPLKNRIEAGEEIFPLDTVYGLLEGLSDYYSANLAGPLAMDLEAAVARDRTLGLEEGPSTELTMSVVEKYYAVVKSMDDRYRGMEEGTIPAEAIRDGLTRAVPFYKIP